MQHVPAVIQTLAPIIHKYGYIGVFCLVLLEDFGVPVPGETTLIAAAFFAGLGHLSILIVVITAVIAAVIGDNIGFAIGKYGGHPLVDRFGKYVFLTPERIGRAEEWFRCHGGKIVTVARFIEGLRQANGILAGLSDMRWGKFLIFNMLGALLWAAAWSAVGYYSGNHIAELLKYQLYGSIAVIALIVIYIVLRLSLKRRPKPAR